MNKASLFLSLILLSFLTELHAQSESQANQTVTIILTDGSEIVGELVSNNDKEVIIQNQELGLLTFQQDQIKKIVFLDEKGRIINPNPTRYFLGQPAFNLPKGEGYYQNIYGVVNIFGYGISDHLSAMAGVELITLFSGSPAFITNVKYGTQLTNKVHIAASATYLFGVGEISSDLNVGTLNALITYGTREHNITVGSGFAFAETQFDNSGIVTISGMTRISKRFAFITENYFLTTGQEALLSGGFRLINKKSSIDLMVTEGFLPLLDIVFTF